MSETKRTKLVVWSGGLDSTLVLHNLAKESSEDNHVIALSFIPEFLSEEKIKMERESRKNYLRFAKDKGYHIIHHTIKISSTIFPIGYYPQQRYWFFNILPYIGNNHDVYFGYIQGDCIWPINQDFIDIFEKHKHITGDYDAELHFPLTYKNKWEVLKEFKEAKIPMDCFWTCETPEIEDNKIIACGTCNPCINLNVAKYTLKLNNKINKKIGKTKVELK